MLKNQICRKNNLEYSSITSDPNLGQFLLSYLCNHRKNGHSSVRWQAEAPRDTFIHMQDLRDLFYLANFPFGQDWSRERGGIMMDRRVRSVLGPTSLREGRSGTYRSCRPRAVRQPWKPVFSSWCKERASGRLVSCSVLREGHAWGASRIDPPSDPLVNLLTGVARWWNSAEGWMNMMDSGLDKARRWPCAALFPAPSWQ